MAIMIPSIPNKFEPESGEDIVFYALKNLPGDPVDEKNVCNKYKNDYYIFHSFKINQVNKETNMDEEHEIDFLIFHPSKGIICVECKSGKGEGGGKALSETTIVNNEVLPREWYHAKIKIDNGTKGVPPLLVKSDNDPMIEGGPFKQAWNRKQDLIRLIKDIKLHEWGEEKLKYHCKITYAVCFPKISSAEEEYSYRSETCKFKDFLDASEPNEHVIYGEDLLSAETLENKLNIIFDYKLKNKYRGIYIETGNKGSCLHDEDIQNLFDRVLCPYFNIVETVDPNTGETKYIRLNEDQIRVLDLLMTKKEMAVSGMAGTGKTILALHLARKKAMKGEELLFLCRSRFQKEELEKHRLNSKIEFRDIEWFTGICSSGSNSESNKSINDNIYNALCEKIVDEKIERGELKSGEQRKKKRKKKRSAYELNTIIIDEAQDFCKGKVLDILKTLYSDIKNSSESSAREKLLKQRFEERTVGIEKSFYIFYDEFQTEDDSKILEFAQKIRNHIELEKNCRNTINTTKSALNPMVDITSSYCQRSEPGKKVKIDFYEFESGCCTKLDNILRNYNLCPQDTVILTFKSDYIAEQNQHERSLLLEFPQRLVDENGKALSIDKLTADRQKDKYYKLDEEKRFFFTNWKNFQGLEKRNIVFVDFEPEKLFGEEYEVYSKCFYVCLTRAQEEVYILAQNPDSIVFFDGFDVLEKRLFELDSERHELNESYKENDNGELELELEDNTKKIDEASKDPHFMLELDNCIREKDDLKLEKLAHSSKVPAEVLKDFYRLSVKKGNVQKVLKEEKDKLKEKLNEGLVNVYLEFKGISKRIAVCTALGAESIYDNDAIMITAFKKLYKLGKRAARFHVKENEFHEYIRYLISIWSEKFYEYDRLYSDNTECREDEDLDLKNYENNGGNLHALKEAFRIASDWKKGNGIVEMKKSGYIDIVIKKRLSKDFWPNFIILAESIWERYHISGESGSLQKDGSLLKDEVYAEYVKKRQENVAEFIELEREAMEYYFKASLQMDKLNLYERQEAFEMIDLRISGFINSYLEYINLIRFNEERN